MEDKIGKKKIQAGINLNQNIIANPSKKLPECLQNWLFQKISIITPNPSTQWKDNGNSKGKEGPNPKPPPLGRVGCFSGSIQ